MTVIGRVVTEIFAEKRSYTISGNSFVRYCIVCSHAFSVLSPFPGCSFESFRLTECDLGG